MTCSRCQGFMIGEGYYGTPIDSGEPSFSAWRCVNCGEVVDPVITAHRRRPSQAVSIGATLPNEKGTNGLGTLAA